MKKTFYTSAIIALLSMNTLLATAQTWHGKHAGLPTGFSASKVYGDGTSIIVTNSSAFSGSQVYYTPDSGTAYTASPSSLGMFATMESDVVKCMGVLFAGSTGGLYKSHDNGQTWVPAGSPGAIYALYSHNDTLYASAGAGVGIPEMSVDTGNTWLTVGYTGPLTVSFLRSGGRFFAGSTSNLQYTDDFHTWTAITSPSGMNGVSIVGLATLSGNIYAACSNGVYKSADNGATWSNVLAKVMFSLKAVDTSLLGGTATNGIYQSSQDGVTWATVNTGLPYTGVATYNSINSISYNSDYLICSAGGDSAVYVIGLGSLGLHPSSGTLDTRLVKNTGTEISVFPNPARETLTILLPPATSGAVSASILDIAGRCVSSVTSENKSTLTLSVKDLEAGTYILLVHCSAGTVTRQITVVR